MSALRHIQQSHGQQVIWQETLMFLIKLRDAPKCVNTQVMLHF